MWSRQLMVDSFIWSLILGIYLRIDYISNSAIFLMWGIVFFLIIMNISIINLDTNIKNRTTDIYHKQSYLSMLLTPRVPYSYILISTFLEFLGLLYVGEPILGIFYFILGMSMTNYVTDIKKGKYLKYFKDV